jgi:hypothetical protein
MDEDIKVKLSSCITQMKEAGRVKVKSHTFYTPKLNEGEGSTSRSGCFTPREKAPPTH